MKRITLLITILLSLPAFAYVNLPPGKGQVVVRDASATNIPTAFGSAGAELFTGTSGKTRVALYNGTTTLILVSTSTTTSNCSGGTDNAFVPPSGTATLENLSINTKVCVRAYGASAISSGLVAVSLW